MSYLHSLMDYKLWTNNLLFTAAKTLTNFDLVAPRKIVFGSILQTLHHTYAMDCVWKANLQLKSHGYLSRRPNDCPNLVELESMQQEIDLWYIDYAKSLHKPDQDKMVDFTFIGGGTGSMSRADILFHVVNHGTYHRGNVTSFMYECGITPPTTDYPVYLREISDKFTDRQT